MRVLALNAYHGGSHRAFLETWIPRSRHAFEVLTLPPRHWKWRMRHAAIHFADACQPLRDERFDAVFCTDMLNLAEFRALAPASIGRLPAVAYFHENQLAYPSRVPDELRPRDAHFALTNLTTALAARGRWFNSRFNLESMVGGLRELLGRMPDHPPLQQVERVRRDARILPPPVEDEFFAPQPAPPGAGGPRPMRIAWAARWEHDKAPEVFAEALGRLISTGQGFEVVVLGPTPDPPPPEAVELRRALGPRLIHWGFVEGQSGYREALAGADVFVSTARHEFFGLAAVEAVALGLMPIVPGDLAYPETLEGAPEGCFYDGSAAGLAGRLAAVGGRFAAGGGAWPGSGEGPAMRRRVASHAASRRVPRLDEALEEAAAGPLAS